LRLPIHILPWSWVPLRSVPTSGPNCIPGPLRVPSGLPLGPSSGPPCGSPIGFSLGSPPGRRSSRSPAISGPGLALERPGFWHPSSASGTSARISPASTPGPDTLGIWLPFRAPQGRRCRLFCACWCPAGVFHPATLLGFEASAVSPARPAATGRPCRSALVPLPGLHGVPSLGRAVPVTSFRLAAVAFPTPSPLCLLWAPLPRRSPRGPVTVLTLGRLQGFEPSARSFATPRDIPPSAGQVRSCPFPSWGLFLPRRNRALRPSSPLEVSRR
jgi:hypothetical protein